MPPALAAIVPAVIGAGTAIYGASQQKKAAQAGLDAQTAANDKALALQQQARDQNVAIQQPFIQGGQAAYAQLLSQFGLPASGGAAPTADERRASGGVDGSGRASTAAPQGFDAAAYLAQNPDVAESAQSGWLSTVDPGDLNGDGKTDTLDRAIDHYRDFGKSEGRAAPGVAPDLMHAPRPSAPAAPTFTAPNVGQAPTFGPAPDASSFFGSFQEDPGTKYQIEQAMRAVNAGFGARGLLKSGAAASAIGQRVNDIAAQSYGNWWNRQNNLFSQALSQYNTANARDLAQWNTNTDRTLNQSNIDRNVGLAQWNTDVNRQDLNFNQDRAYQTSRQDTQTGNLFNLANIGLGAAGNVAGANSAYANNASNIFGSQANAASDAAAQRAAANAGMVGSIGGSASNYAANYGLNPFAGSTALGAPQTSAAAYQLNPYNPASLNTTSRVPNVVF